MVLREHQWMTNWIILLRTNCSLKSNWLLTITCWFTVTLRTPFCNWWPFFNHPEVTLENMFQTRSIVYTPKVVATIYQIFWSKSLKCPPFCFLLQIRENYVTSERIIKFGKSSSGWEIKYSGRLFAEKMIRSIHGCLWLCPWENRNNQ